MIGIQLIVIIVVTSMAIAYVGDILGKRIGKKRISLFGLRPRTTAMIITIITGGIISIATFGLLILFSSQMRQMLLDTEKMQKQRSELQGEIRKLSDDKMTLIYGLDKLKIESDGYRDDAVLLSDEIVNKQVELDELTKNSIDLKNKITELENQFSTSQKQLTATSIELKKLKDEYNKTNTEMDFISSEITILETEREKKETQISNLNKDITKLLTRIKQMNDEITRLQTEKPAFIEGSRIYGFTLRNDLFISEITDAIYQSFEDFESSDFETTKGCTIKQPSSETLYYDVIEKMSTSSAAKSIILVSAAENSFPSDEIPVEFQVYDQYIVFSKGTLIVEETVDKKLGLFEASGLAAKLVHDGAGKALERGLLPDPVAIVMTFTPKAYNVIAEQIVKHHRPMKIQLYASKDIYRGVYLDETNLRFEIIDAD
ncbi:MAG: DUF3084 domain-containing protein [bacterium]